jgi:hypothetical protein
VFITAIVEPEGLPPEAHFILLVKHPRDYARGARLQYVGRASLADYRDWERTASRFVHGTQRDPAVIAFSEAARAATEALDYLHNVID